MSSPPSSLLGVTAPNAPSGFVTYSSRDFGSKASSGNDWAGAQGWAPYEELWPNLSLVSDATAPGSLSSVLRYSFPAGLPSGNGPALTHYDIPSKTARSVYVSTWVRFSPNFTASMNKIYYVNWTGGSFVMNVNEINDGTHNILPLALNLNVNHAAFQYSNIQTGQVLQRGKWHLIEFALTLSSASNAPDGSVKIWLDGSLVLNKPALPIPGTIPFTEVRYAPVYGGKFAVPVRSNMWMDIDHVQISGR